MEMYAESNHGNHDTSDNTRSSSDEESQQLKNNRKRRQSVIAKKENIAVDMIRVITALVLFLVTAIVSYVVYKRMVATEVNNFRRQFSFHADKIIEQFQVNSAVRLEALDTFAQSITSWESSSNETFPMVTLPDFENRATATIALASVMTITWCPKVPKQQFVEYSAYSVQNQDWYLDGLALQKDVNKTAEAEGIAQFSYVTNLLAPENADKDPYTEQQIVPFVFGSPTPYNFYSINWQFAPVLPIASAVNYDLLSHPGLNASHLALHEHKQPIVGAGFDFSDESNTGVIGRLPAFNLLLNRSPTKDDYEAGPVSDLFLPVWDSFDTDKRELAGLLQSLVWWQAYFVNLLPDNGNVFAVLENSCGQEYTYRIDGKFANYIGQGSLIDEDYEEMMVETGMGALTGNAKVDLDLEGACYYNVRVYPTSESAHTYRTNEPVVFTIVILAVFAFTSFVFLAYDFLVQRRHDVVHESATSTGAVVRSLFPDGVRDRVVDHSVAAPRPAGYASYGRRSSLGGMAPSISDDIDIDDSVPIADLHPNCTVMFADISGFTRWSSDRSPADVFKLLETLYGAFDKIARRRHVFKVETIGDCYVAVTGLPKAQPDHARIMAKFANDCLFRLQELKPILSNRLGRSVKDLEMRVGLHSGPVTAGVLRGEKARFQLFGDTVNTAARMESNGTVNRIHVTEETAEELRMAGYEDCLEEREDLVHAKGKGMMQTYWVDMNVAGSGKSIASSNGNLCSSMRDSQHMYLQARRFTQELMTEDSTVGGDDDTVTSFAGSTYNMCT